MAVLTPDMSGMQSLGMLARQRRRRASQLPQMQQGQGQTLAQAQMQGGMQSAVRSAAANPTSQGLSSTQPPAVGAVQQTQLQTQRSEIQQAGVEPTPMNTLRRKKRAPNLSAQAIT